MLSGSKFIVTHRTHVFMHMCTSRSQLLTRAVKFSLLKIVILSPNSNSMCSNASVKFLPMWLHPTFYSVLVKVFL